MRRAADVELPLVLVEPREEEPDAPGVRISEDQARNQPSLVPDRSQLRYKTIDVLFCVKVIFL